MQRVYHMAVIETRQPLAARAFCMSSLSRSSATSGTAQSVSTSRIRMASEPIVLLHPTCSNPLTSRYRGPFLLNMAGAGDGGEGEGGEGEGDKGKKEGGDGDAGKNKDGDDKKKTAKTRIETLLEERDKEREGREVAETKLKEYEDKKKADEEEKMKQEGKTKELLETKEKELVTATESKAQLQKKVEAFEKIATEQVKSALESIEDDEKRKDAQALLEGRDLAEQFKLIPTILKLAGTETKSGFGGNTPSSSKMPGKNDLERKKARYQELLDKPNLTPKEQNEKNTLMFELSKEHNKSEKT